MLLEGNQSLSFDINKGPNRMQFMGFFARFMLLPSHHLQNFKKMFQIGFITLELHIFSPTIHDTTLCYIAYCDAK